MAKYIYNRCSTQHQDFAQQQNTINSYLLSQNINPKTDINGTVVEHVSGAIKHTDRKLHALIDKCKAGDSIYFSELSRLGRNMRDLYEIVAKCVDRDINLIQCKDGMKIENKSIQGTALLFALSLASQIELDNIHLRVSSGGEVARNELKQYGKRVTRKGNLQTKWGREKGCDTSAAVEAATLARTQSKRDWQKQSAAYNRALLLYQKGRTRNEIVEDLGELYDQQPDVYCTRNGKKLTPAVLSRWLSGANPVTP